MMGRDVMNALPSPSQNPQPRPAELQVRPTDRRVTLAEQFEELEIELGESDVAFKYVYPSDLLQLGILWGSMFLFMLFVVVMLPAMKVTAIGNTLWISIGLVILIGIGLADQARVRSTTIRLTSTGVTVDQGTMLDREVVNIGWKDLQSAELEPVDVDKADKGMELVLTPKDGKPVRALASVGVGDLHGMRQAILKAKTER